MSRFRNRCRLLLLALLPGLLPATGYAQLPPGISGSWYQPEHAGHGLSIEILSERQALMFWYSYDPAGNPLVLYIDGRVEGREIAGRALAPRGMRFGSFDSATLQLPAWGDVRVEFSDCDRATLRWNANGEAGGGGFGIGELPLQRLTRIAGSSCSFDRRPPVPIGKYDIAFRRRSSPCVAATQRAAVDPQGRLWAMELWETEELRAQEGMSLPSIPGPAYVRCQAEFINIISEPIGDDGALAFELRHNTWSNHTLVHAAPGHGRLLETATGTSGEATADATTPPPDFIGVEIARSNKAPDELSQPLDVAALAGRYRFLYLTQFFVGFSASLHLDAQGDICIEPALETGCLLRGRLQGAFDGYGFFDFTLEGDRFGVAVQYQGRGWAQLSSKEPGRSELVLIGTGPDRIGFGLVVRK